MSRATRRIVVAHLTDRGMPPGEIASELGVSVDTVRRDVREGAPPAPSIGPEPAAPVAANPDALVLPLDPPLREALAVLRSVRNGPDTEQQNRAVVRAAVRATADAVREAGT
ncbi:helix-turn-helix domain-containing protein [Streptomyces sp. NPDC026672]|uniref:helix-turn-helix domain-containing protein n=1 Tax=unclassified Streptomyces TaxID=2593676 RepID=UPI00341105C8